MFYSSNLLYLFSFLEIFLGLFVLYALSSRFDTCWAIVLSLSLLRFLFHVRMLCLISTIMVGRLWKQKKKKTQQKSGAFNHLRLRAFHSQHKSMLISGLLFSALLVLQRHVLFCNFPLPNFLTYSTWHLQCFRFFFPPSFTIRINATLILPSFHRIEPPLRQ